MIYTMAGGRGLVTPVFVSFIKNLPQKAPSLPLHKGEDLKTRAYAQYPPLSGLSGVGIF